MSITSLSISEHANDQLINGVIEKLLDGVPLREAVKQAGLTPQSFHRRLAKDKEAAAAYARAVEIKADLMADEVVHLADGDGDPAKVRNQMQARQWLASKLYAKRYGDRIDLNVTQTIDVGATLAEARARLLPRRDLATVEEVQTIDLPRELEARATDKQSVAPDVSSIVPDIFS